MSSKPQTKVVKKGAVLPWVLVVLMVIPAGIGVYQIATNEGVKEAAGQVAAGDWEGLKKKTSDAYNDMKAAYEADGVDGLKAYIKANPEAAEISTGTMLTELMEENADFKSKMRTAIATSGLSRGDQSQLLTLLPE